MRVENGFSLRLTKVDLEKLSRGIALIVNASCLNDGKIDTLTIRVAAELPELDQPENRPTWAGRPIPANTYMEATNNDG